MPRHPPIALTSRLRIHTTIDRPVLLAGADIRWFGLFGSIAVEDTIEPTQLDNHCCLSMVERISLVLAHKAALPIHAVTASISRTHSQCQRGGKSPTSAAEAAKFWSSSSGKSVGARCTPGGAYRDRTDDLKLAKLALSQLS